MKSGTRMTCHFYQVVSLGVLQPTLLNLRASEPANRRLMKVVVTPGVGSLSSAVAGQTDSDSVMSVHDTSAKRWSDLRLKTLHAWRLSDHIIPLSRKWLNSQVIGYTAVRVRQMLTGAVSCSTKMSFLQWCGATGVPYCHNIRNVCWSLLTSIICLYLMYCGQVEECGKCWPWNWAWVCTVLQKMFLHRPGEEFEKQQTLLTTELQVMGPVFSKIGPWQPFDPQISSLCGDQVQWFASDTGSELLILCLTLLIYKPWKH